MPLYEYTAFDKIKREKIKATVEAGSEDEVLRLLDEKKLTLINPKLLKSSASKKSAGFSFLNRIKSKDIVIFSRQFAVMLKASVPVVKSLRILIKQTSNPRLQKVIAVLSDEVDGGMRLSHAMAEFPHVFSEFFVAMIKSGETSGQLDEVLEYLANSQEKDYDLISKIKGAMTYPIFIVCALVGVGLVMMIVVVPKLTAILTETGGTLPITTQILISVSGFLKNYWWLILILLILAIIGIRYSTKTASGKRFWDIFVLRIPIFGQLFRKIYLVRFTRSLATLTSGGIHLVEALKITSEVVGNRVYRDILEKTIKEVEEGNQIASVLIQSKDVPPMVSYMVSVGEQTGKLDVVLSKLSDFYSREIDNLVVNLVSLIEPIIMLVLGLAVGVMVAAIIMPMYNLASAL